MNVTQVIKNFVEGISQQPPILRHPEQLEEQINGLSTEAGGLQKRPPTLFITSEQADSIDNKTLIHVINRDTNERYITAFTTNGIYIWDIKGNKQMVENYNNTYLRCANPREDLSVVTVADYTFIVNKTRTARMQNDVETTEEQWKNQGGLIYVKSGQYGRKYRVMKKEDDSIVSEYETPDGSEAKHVKYIRISNLVYEIQKGFEGNEEFQVLSYQDSWVQVTNADRLKVDDGFNKQAMIIFDKTVARFSDLPATAPDGYIVLVKGEVGGMDDYYVRYNDTTKVWEETVRPNTKTTINGSTMPHALVRRADGTFEVRILDWAKRITGDDDSNPIPSFIDKKIADVFFFRNRLGFIAGENVCLSASGDYFQFWVDSAVELQDTDPIDMAVSHNQVSTLHNAVPFNEDLYLFSAQTQFVLKADGVLSPKNARLDQVTEFSADSKVKPVGAGKNLYFSSERSNFTTVREYFAVQDIADIKDANDITAHIPNFIPNGVYKLISSTNENILIALTSGDNDSMYVYKYLYIQDQKLQASWSKWTFSGEIIGADFMDSTLFIVLKRKGRIFIEKLFMAYNTKDFYTEPYRVHLDSKRLYKVTSEELESISHNAYGVYGLPITCVTSDGIVFRTDDSGHIRFPEDVVNQTVVIGLDYEFKMTLSTFYLKQQNEMGTQYLPDYKLMLRNFWINYADTGYFRTIVRVNGKGTYKYLMTGRFLGTESNRLDRVAISTGQQRVPLQTQNTNAVVSVINDTPLPSALVGGGWEANVISRFKLIN